MLNFRLIYSSLLLLLFGVAGLIEPTAHAGKLYKWVDAQGRISYQDSPPPSGATLLKESTFSDTSKANLADDLNTTLGKSPVQVYTINNCEPCELLLARLKQLGISIDERSLLNREIQRQVLQETKSLSAPTLRIEDKFVTDISEQNLIKELISGGYLEKQETTDNDQIDESASVDENPDNQHAQ